MYTRSVAAFTALVACLLAWASTPVRAMPAKPSVVHGSSVLIGRRMLSGGLTDGALREYAAFWGVPFAQPPVGELRFKPPVPVSLASGTSYHDNEDIPACLQQRRTPATLEGVEDCLKLNIYTTNYDSSTLPVLVFLHGGGFMYGQGLREGLRYLMDHEMVVVTVDYRLGILGFLSAEDAVLPGNMGMQDMVEALRWVRNNIGLFGGDSSRVTVAGFSAGAASSLLLTMSPQSKGLFHRVIAMSGSPLCPWALQQSARERALTVANLTNCTANSTAAMVACLQKKDARELVALQGTHLQDWLQNPFSPFAPVVDRWATSPFLPEEPRSALNSMRGVMDVPMMLSLTQDEGLYTAAEFVMDPDKVGRLDRQWESDAARLLHFHDDQIHAERKADMARKIREHYLQNASLASGWRNLVKMMSDRSFAVGVAEHARMQAAMQKSPVHVYRFAYRGEFSLSVHESGGNTVNMGVSHADDFQYLFDMSWNGPMTNIQDVLMRQQMAALWASFANGMAPRLGNATWTPVSRRNDGDALEYLLVSSPTNMTMVKEKDVGQSSFWKSLNHAGHTTGSLSLCMVSTFVVSLLAVTAKD